MSKASKVLAAAVSLSAGLLMLWEGKREAPYYDIAGVLTDCYGNTYHVSPGVIRSDAECERLLKTEAGRLGKNIIKDAPGIPLPVLAAGISLSYNIGSGAYARSTFRRKLKQGAWDEACDALLMWNKYTNPRTGRLELSQGLVNRRAKEYELCMQYREEGE